MTTITKACYSTGSGSKPLPRVVIGKTVDPKCIVAPEDPKPGDVITYNPSNCTRVVDSAAGTLALDLNGVPTITGANGSLGYDWGLYTCTVTYNGTSKTIYVSHTADATTRAAFTFNLDANGWTDQTPPAGARLIYVDPNELDNESFGPLNNGTDHYIMGTSTPSGGWKTPTSVNAYQTLNAALGAVRDGEADTILLLDSETHTLSASLSLSGRGGRSNTERHQITSYGTTGNARAHINWSGDFVAISVFFESYWNFFDLDIYPTFHDPNHGDWNGWGVDTPPDTGIEIYTGGGASDPPSISGITIENCRVRYATTGISVTGQGGIQDLIIRRNVVEWNFDETDNAQGISIGDNATLEQPIWDWYVGENFIDHNGWYTQTYDISGTAMSGNTTTLTHTGAFTGLTLDSVALHDVANDDWTFIESNTNDTVTFTAHGSVDFTGGGAYEIGYQGAKEGGAGATEQGQASIFNHNLYVRVTKDSILENNVISRGSSIAVKNTADSDSSGEESDTGYHPTDGFIEQYNLVIDNEFGLGGGGNDDLGVGSRFANVRYCDNVIIDQGNSNPTNREVGRGSQLNDTRNGLMSGNLALSTNATATNGPYGFALAGHTINTVFAGNKAFNAGLDSTAANSGSFYINRTSANFQDVYIYNNDFVERGDAVLIGDYPSASDAEFTWANNRYDNARADASAVVVDGSSDALADFLTTTGETGSDTSGVTYRDEGASIANYQAKRGGTATYSAFLTEIVGQSKADWDETLLADRVIQYFKSSFQDRPDVIFEPVIQSLTDLDVGGTFDIGFSNVGTVKGAIFLMVYGSSGGGVWGTPYAAPGFSIGFTDGTNHWCTTFRGDPEVSGDQEAYSSHGEDWIMRDNQGTVGVTNGVQGEYKLNSFGTNTLQIEVTENPIYPAGEIRNCVVIGIGGSDINEIVVGSHALGTGTASQTIDTGHRTHLALFSSCLANEIHDVVGGGGNVRIQDNSSMTFGVAAECIDGLKQMAYAYAMDNGGTPAIDPSQVTAAIYNDSVAARISDGATESYSVSVDALHSTGFNVSQSATGDGAYLGYMSFNFKSLPKMNMVDTTYPSTGNYSITDIAFKGGFGMWLNLAGSSAYNTAQDIDNSLGITVMDSSNTYTVNTTMADNDTQADNLGQCNGESALALLEKGASTTEMMRATGAFTDTGMTWTTSDTPGETIPGRLFVMGIN